MTVVGVDDLLFDGDIAYQIVADLSVSNDFAFSNLNAGPIAVLNLDNEVPAPAAAGVLGIAGLMASRRRR
ncbi:MAG: hypothetical protein AAFR38_14600 [Planctomycetota bacterium]